jgi:uncharacterized protein
VYSSSEGRGSCSTIRWEITLGFPHGGDYAGVEAVVRDFFGRVLADFDGWSTVMNEVHDAGDRVLALGTYSGRAKTTGKTFVARFSHCWTVEGGTMVRLQQCADTAQISRALEA